MNIQNKTDQRAKNLRVMIVDDDEMQLAYVCALLDAAGVTHAMTASTGEDAIAQIENASKKPDLLICDLLMPGMDGFEMMSQLADKKLTMPIIIMSAQAQQVRKSAEIVATIKAFKFLGELEKPVELSALKLLLDKIDQQ